MNKEGMTSIVAKQQAFFQSGTTHSVSFRLEMLKRLKDALHTYEKEILDALHLDLGKSAAEAYMTELGMAYQELGYAMKNLRKWAKPKAAGGTLATWPARSYIYQEPYGVVLILTPWNYPVNLSLCPLVGAIAAGNCAVLKCSHSSVHTSEVIRKMIHATFPEKYIFCPEADTDYDDILDQDYQYIFFTGSPKVGKTVMKKASERLIPVTLELGGKSPCIVDASADLKLAARRIVWGKFLNAGQTCVSVDYILVDNNVKETLIKLMEKEIKKHYNHAEKRDDYPCIINQRHFNRLVELMGTEETIIGGACNPDTRRIAPTILPGADFDHPIMEEEIFGPLLPVIGYDKLSDACAEILKRPHPLACYIFSRKPVIYQTLINQLPFGGGCVNDVIMHLSNHHIPFGGVGNSGMGGYHGIESFKTFSHAKGMLIHHGGPDVPVRYAPFNDMKLWILKKLFDR